MPQLTATSHEELAPLVPFHVAVQCLHNLRKGLVVEREQLKELAFVELLEDGGANVGKRPYQLARRERSGHDDEGQWQTRATRTTRETSEGRRARMKTSSSEFEDQEDVR